VYLTWRECRTA